MARLPKPLEEQLTYAEEELQKAKEKVVTWEERIVDIKKQIRNRDMINAFKLLEENNMSVDDLAALLSEKEKKIKK